MLPRTQPKTFHRMTPMTEAATVELLDEVMTFIGRFVVLTKEQLHVLAVWVLHTYAIAAADTTPYISVVSPTKGSGKSRLMEIFEAIACRALYRIDVTPATLFHELEDTASTLLLDEVDAIYKGKGQSNEALRSLLNAGNRRGAVVPRMVKGYVHTYNVFGPRAFAGIGQALPPTVRSRSPEIFMLPKLRTDKVEVFRSREVAPEALALKVGLEAWATEDRVNHLRAQRPKSLPELSDRINEACAPLFAIAEYAGAEWGALLRRSLLVIGKVPIEEKEDRVHILADLREIFGTRVVMHADEILVGLAELGWKLDANGLAAHLRFFRIYPGQLKIAGVNRRGYRAADFAEAWLHFLPAAVKVLKVTKVSRVSKPTVGMGATPATSPVTGSAGSVLSHPQQLAVPPPKGLNP